MKSSISYRGQIKDCEYLQARGATFVQQLAWLATHPRGNNLRSDMDDYLKGSNW